MTTEEIQKILQRRGDARGAVFKTDANYILQKVGPEGLKQVEDKLKEWDIDLNHQTVMPMAWYPVAHRVLDLMAIQETLGWNEQDIKAMGQNAPKVSVVVKLFFKLFPDIGKFSEQIPHYWRKHYTVGELSVFSLDREKKEMILHLKDFAFHPTLCKYLEGYFESATKLTRPKDSVVTAKESQCSFDRQVPYEVFQLNWTK